MPLPAFLEDCCGKGYGYYAEDAGGNKIARCGLDYDTFLTQTANMVVSGYIVTDLDLEQQVALLLNEMGAR